MLHEFIALDIEEIIKRCRTKVAMCSVPPPTEAEIDHDVPVFLEQLANALRLGLISSPVVGGRRYIMVTGGHDPLPPGIALQPQELDRFGGKAPTKFLEALLRVPPKGPINDTRPRGRPRRGSKASRHHIGRNHQATGHARVVCIGCGGVAYECPCQAVQKVETQGICHECRQPAKRSAV